MSKRINYTFLLTGMLFLFCLNLNAQSSHSYSDAPNIVVIMADDLGFSDLGCYGGEIHTPNLDRLAEGGLRFSQFYNCGRCWPSRTSLLSGYYPQQVNSDGERSAFPKWGYLIPHHLKQAGYRSYHSGKWHVPNVKTQVEEGGFDRSYHTGSYDTHFSVQNHQLNDKDLEPTGDSEEYYSTSSITDYAIQFLEEHEQNYKDSPFFLYTAFLAPHFPLQAPQELIEKYKERYLNGWEQLKEQRYQRQKELGFVLGENSPFEYMVTAPWSWPEQWLKDSIPGELRYAKPWHQLNDQEKNLQATKMAIHAAMIDVIDMEVGRIIEQIKSMGEEENTLVLFLSDNGATAEQIIRGNGHKQDSPLGSAETYLCLGPGFSTASNTPFRRHKFWTHEGGVTTPLIAHWPRGIKAKGQIRNSAGHVIDFLPTFLELAGITEMNQRNGEIAPPLPGESMVSVFEGDKQSDREIWFSHRGNKALRQGIWKAVISTDIDGRWQLYNIEDDRTELRNLADNFYQFGNNEWKQKHQEQLQKMIQRWEELSNIYQKQGKESFNNKN
ncbi:MAG: arylsulfatase [Flavobacteriaceae bacterium]|nr:MAG: arylsulfatase [Flavobacteriaceae bacterium]